MRTIHSMNLSDIEGSFEFNGNITDYFDFGDGTEIYGEGTDVFLVVLRILVCTFGMLGNSVVIFVILILREYEKAVTHWYILQLSIADSLFLLTLPFKVVEDIRGEWIFSGGLCKAKEALLFCNYYSSILFLVVMSVDRYVAICHGFSKKLRCIGTKRSAYVISLSVWIASLTLCIPVLLYSDKRGVDPTCKCQYEFPISPQKQCYNEGFQDEAMAECIARKKDDAEEKCHGRNTLNSWNEEPLSTTVDYLETEDVTTQVDANIAIYQMGCSYSMQSGGWIAYVWFNFVVMFLVPFTIISICYCCIALRVKRTRKRRSSVAHESSADTQITISGRSVRKRKKSSASIKAEKDYDRVTCVCLLLILLFLVCWLPFHVVHLVKIKGVEGSPDFCSKLSAVSTLIAYLNSALNPWVYNFVSRGFGKRLRSAATSIKKSVIGRTSPLSSAGVTVRYHIRKQSSLVSSTNSGIVATNIYRRSDTKIYQEDVSQVQTPLVQE